MAGLGKQVVIESFVERYKIHSQEKKIDNSSLYAGSPMYFYCNGCTKHIATLPEDYISPPAKYCDSCEVLVKLGLMDEAKTKVQSQQYDIDGPEGLPVDERGIFLPCPLCDRIYCDHTPEERPDSKMNRKKE